MLCVVERFLWKKGTIYNINECIRYMRMDKKNREILKFFKRKCFIRKNRNFFTGQEIIQITRKNWRKNGVFLQIQR